MAWMQGRIPDFAKTQGQKIRFALKPIWVRALSQIFSQIYITRPCLQFCRHPKIPRIFSFLKFRVFQIFSVQANIWPVKLANRKSEMRNSQKQKILENLGGL